MAKRRVVGAQSSKDQEEAEEVEETAEERRARRDREKRALRKRGPRAAGVLARWPRWKTLSVFAGSAVAIVAAIALVVIFFPHPCLTLSAPPPQSGVPDESAPSWCVNSTDAMEQELFVHLSIVVGGTTVTIPGGIGEISAATAKSQWGFSSGCNMPVFTDNSTGGGSTSDGYIEIYSPWAFTYTLGDFFNIWKESYSTVSINGNSEPVSYAGSQLFNYTSNAKQTVRLWVDGSQSSAGTGLVLNYLTSSAPSGTQTSSEIPQCLVSQYGSGHSIVITWGWVGAGEVVGGPTLFQMPGATLSDPVAPPLLPGPHLTVPELGLKTFGGLAALLALTCWKGRDRTGGSPGDGLGPGRRHR